MFKFFRVTFLLLVFVALAFYTKTQKLKSRNWTSPLDVVIYPMNSENSPIVEDYITRLNSSSFKEIDVFFEQEAEHYQLIIQQPIKTTLGNTLQTFPPAAPTPPFGFIEAAWWSMKLRYWAYNNTPDDKSNLHRVRVFVHYHETVDNKRLDHSLGLDKGLLSVVHAFASKDQEQQNNIVIAHELLHTVGATDKYDRNNQPVFPDGYADPEQLPLFPQSQAEIMTAKIPLSQLDSEMAESLNYCIIGQTTAKEINWLESNSE